MITQPPGLATQEEMYFFPLFIAFGILTIGFARDFQPYADNSGTVVGLAGKNYCIIAADTRLSDSYFIRSRNIRRVHILDSHGVAGEGDGNLLLGASGCLADALGLVQGLRDDIVRYHWENERPLPLRALSHLLSTTLYSRRTFPFYSLCVLGGLEGGEGDDEGEVAQGAVYRYDSVGSFERVSATCAGKGEQLIQPFLDEAAAQQQSGGDSALWSLSQEGDAFLPSVVNATSSFPHVNLTIEEACDLVFKAFQAAAEREITIGDGVEIFVVTHVPQSRPRKNSISRRFYFLPRH